MHNAWTTALGVGPYTGSTFEFVIADGLIQRVAHNRELSRFDPEAYSVWTAWLDDAHPDDYDVMYDTTGPNLTPEALALFEQRVPEFEALQTALRYVVARNDWDGTTAGSLVADDARFVDDRYTTEGVDDVHLATAQYDRSGEWHYRDPQCNARMTSPPEVKVICRYTMANALSEALGVGPYDGSWLDLRVAGGQIQEVLHHFDYGRYSYQVFEVFTGWLDEAHPGDFEVLFGLTGGTAVGHLTPEALALWEQRIPEFVSSQGGS
jgi:hypothetical protein